MTLCDLRSRPHLVEDTAKLLESHWKAGDDYRRDTLRRGISHGNPHPTHYVLVRERREGEGREEVVGHAVVKAACGSTASAVVVESVLVAASERGSGVGTELMARLEKVLVESGVDTIHLSTEFAHGFYTKLGYVRHRPVLVDTFGPTMAAKRRLFELNPPTLPESSPTQWYHKELLKG